MSTMTLKEYEDAALKIISNWRKRNGKLTVSDELIGRMIRFMAFADVKYVEGKSQLSRYAYRQMRGIYAIREYVKEKKYRRRFANLDSHALWDDHPEYDDEVSRKLRFLIKNSGLNKQEKDVIQNTLEGLDKSQVADRLGINYEKCRNLYDSSIKKMKRLIPCQEKAAYGRNSRIS